MRLFVRVFAAATALFLMLALFVPKGRRAAVTAVGAVMVAAEQAGVLTHADRCDVRGCGARAFVRGLFEPVTDEQKTSAIDWCLHHYREVEDKVRATAYHVIDERYEVLPSSTGTEPKA